MPSLDEILDNISKVMRHIHLDKNANGNVSNLSVLASQPNVNNKDYKSKYQNKRNSHKGGNAHTRNGHVSAPAVNECLFCSASQHRSAMCPKVSTVAGRRDILNNKKLCKNCTRNHLPNQKCGTPKCSLCSMPGHADRYCWKT